MQEEGETTDEPTTVWKKSLSDLDMEAEFDADELGPIKEEMVVQVMEWLEREITSSSPSNLQETEFVTINGNEETCGSSFSGTVSTVMASVDTRRIYVAPYLASSWPFAAVPVDEPACKVDIIGESSAFIDGDDEWMDFIIACDLMEIEGLK